MTLPLLEVDTSEGVSLGVPAAGKAIGEDGTL